MVDDVRQSTKSVPGCQAHLLRELNPVVRGSINEGRHCFLRGQRLRLVGGKSLTVKSFLGGGRIRHDDDDEMKSKCRFLVDLIQ